jgi:hypothetical protein
VAVHVQGEGTDDEIQVTSEKITLSVDSSKELELPERLRLYVSS